MFYEKNLRPFYDVFAFVPGLETLANLVRYVFIRYRQFLKFHKWTMSNIDSHNEFQRWIHCNKDTVDDYWNISENLYFRLYEFLFTLCCA
jgi:hypothetical protein